MLISTSITNLLSRWFTILWICCLQKLNFLLLDIASIRSLVFQAFQKLSSLLTCFMLHKESKILYCIHIKYIQLLFQMSSEDFFIKNHNNSIEFWEYPSQCNWSLYKTVDMETKQFHPQPLYPCKSSWDFNKKSKYNDILSNWKMTFQTLDLKKH